MTRYVLALFALLLSGCMTPAPIQPPSTFYVMRHLDTLEGSSDPDLTEAGQRRAALLADWFAEEPPLAIFVSDTRRARQTAAPLAEKLGITPRIYDPSDSRGLIMEVMKEPAPVLIVAHSNTVPDIVYALSGERPDPLVHADFGDIWRIAGKDRTVTKTRLP
ncbi:SixA phosphatase family protein [Sphingosinicella rhizophila]|uniref:Phosphoglycerate mutase family protein n=1 Tax=Sphingosinicella rhizophila TaxID=3050082 RepID=A0ABU3Q6A4_9SPHN|nr:phosphoglycerate mutase family protein [Sphingosinicella sp. GR2756]MDT9598936.1 phosphoglycerate mutase family protein [Sphingosinicella sp. GR2756]